MTAALPTGWAEATLGDVLSRFEAGRSLKAEGRPAEPQEFGVLKISAVTWGEFDASENKALLQGDQPKDHETVRKGDLLISRANTSELVGAVVRVPRDHPNLMLPDKLLRLVLETAAVDPDFVKFALRTRPVRGYFEREATGTSHSMRNLSQPKMRGAPLRLPPLNEQRRIVSKLEALQQRTAHACAALDAIPPLLEKFRQSVLAAAFRGDLTADWRARNPDVEPASVLLERIRKERRRRWEEAELAKMKAKGKVPKDDRWKGRYKEPPRVEEAGLPELPAGWSWAALEELAEKVTDGTHQPPPFSSDGTPFLVIRNVVTGEIDWDSVSKWVTHDVFLKYTSHLRPRRGDVLYTAVGSYGVALEVETDREFMFQRHIAHVRPVVSRESRLLVPRFLATVLNAPSGRQQADAVARGVAQKTVTLKDLKRFAIPLPPVAEQKEVIQRLEVRLARSAAITESITDGPATLSLLEQSILAKAFRGDLVPQDPDDEPASKLLERIRAARLDKPARRTRRRARKPKAAPGQLAIVPPPEPTSPSEPALPATDLRDRVHRALLGYGPMERDAAIRHAAAALRDAGAVDYRRLRRGGPLYRSLDAAVDAALAAGLLDQPTSGEVRAILEKPRDYTPEHWRHVLLACLGDDAVDRAEAVEACAWWAAENMGLEFQRLRRDGVIVRGLEAALDVAIRDGEFERDGPTDALRRTTGKSSSSGGVMTLGHNHG